MSVERTEDMTDFMGAPLEVGDFLLISSANGPAMYFATIKSFSENGIYGPHFWKYKNYGLEYSFDKKLQMSKIYCSSSYAMVPWFSKWGFTRRCLKLDPVQFLEVDIYEKYKEILIRTGIEEPGDVRTEHIRL